MVYAAIAHEGFRSQSPNEGQLMRIRRCEIRSCLCSLHVRFPFPVLLLWFASRRARRAARVHSRRGLASLLPRPPSLARPSCRLRALARPTRIAAAITARTMSAASAAPVTVAIEVGAPPYRPRAGILLASTPARTSRPRPPARPPACSTAAREGTTPAMSLQSAPSRRRCPGPRSPAPSGARRPLRS